MTTIRTSGSTVNVKTASQEELLDLKQALTKDRLEIQSQLEEAKLRYVTEGVRADTGWFHRAKYAFRLKGIQIQEVSQEIGYRRKEDKKENIRLSAEQNEIFARAFMRAAQRRLPSGLWFALLREAELESPRKGQS